MCVRVCGLLALGAGTGLLIVGVMLAVHRGAVSRIDAVTTNPELGQPLSFAGLWLVILGVAVVRARTFRPDLGDASHLIDPFGMRMREVLPPKRTWWTCDPVPQPEDPSRVASSHR